MEKNKKLRCAIYTRVSTDRQAEKEYNSCEAQQEKIISFIKAHDDMRVCEVYDDAGYTGANINRPAMQELLDDIKCAKLDMVIVYKIDRLTRSPKDFYNLIEIFGECNVGFISITERFDTSTPAGRLLRNIMLTFAQFERELTSERTKDKLLQRAEKGMWNGGISPYGYERKNKKLEIVDEEANVVRMIYETYVETGTTGNIYKMLKEKKIKRKLKNKDGEIVK